MAESPLVTILVQSYNHAPYIRECILSVLNQTWQNVELIVYDDGSSDGSDEILSEMSEEYGFEYLHKENEGLVRTILRMLPLVKGKYFTMMASDDVFPVDKLEKQVTYMEQTECMISAGRGSVIDAHGKTRHYIGLDQVSEGICSFEDIFCGVKQICSPTLLLRSDLIREMEIVNPDYPIEDFYLMLKITAAGYPIHIIDEVLAIYRVHGANTHLNFEKMFRETKRILDIYKDHSQYRDACRYFCQGFFSSMAIYQKWATLKVIPQVFELSPQFFIRFMKILIPPFMWKMVKGKERV